MLRGKFIAIRAYIKKKREIKSKQPNAARTITNQTPN
jgi:hypothetical protein